MTARNRAGRQPRSPSRRSQALDPSSAAFFDIDNTLIHGASMFHWARGLAKHKYLSRGQILDFVWKQTRFIVVGKEDADDMRDVTSEALSLVKGRNQAELVTLTREIFNEYMIDRFWPGTVALAQGHMDAGQRVWLVSAAPIELAELIAEHLGLSGALGTVSEQIHGVYTGRLVGKPLHGQAKAEAVTALAQREGLDLSRCSAYSRLLQRHPAAVFGRHPGGGQPGSCFAPACPSQRLDRAGLPHDPPRGESHRPRSGCGWACDRGGRGRGDGAPGVAGLGAWGRGPARPLGLPEASWLEVVVLVSESTRCFANEPHNL